MQLVTDKPCATNDPRFLCMGILSDCGKDYAALLNVYDGAKYIEKIEWGAGRIISTSNFKYVEDDKEWETLFLFIQQTTIFSPVKIKLLVKTPQVNTYTYSRDYMQTEDYIKRKQKGIL
jgi:hypothetical protein